MCAVNIHVLVLTIVERDSNKTHVQTVDMFTCLHYPLNNYNYSYTYLIVNSQCINCVNRLNFIKTLNPRNVKDIQDIQDIRNSISGDPYTYIMELNRRESCTPVHTLSD